MTRLELQKKYKELRAENTRLRSLADALDAGAKATRDRAGVVAQENTRLEERIVDLEKQVAGSLEGVALLGRKLGGMQRAIDEKVEENTRQTEEAALYKQRYQEKAAESQAWAAKAGAHAAENTRLRAELEIASEDHKALRAALGVALRGAKADGDAAAYRWLDQLRRASLPDKPHDERLREKLAASDKRAIRQPEPKP